MIPVHGNVRTLHDAVYTMLDNALPVAVGDSEAPDTLPHVIVYAVRGGLIEGSLGEPDVDATVPYQITCVSRRRDQAEWLQHEVRDIFLSQSLIVPGRGISRIYVSDPSGIDRDSQLGELEGQLFYSTDIFTIMIGPE